MERGGASKREREREGLCLYVRANNLPVAPLIGEGRVRGKRGRKGEGKGESEIPPH